MINIKNIIKACGYDTHRDGTITFGKENMNLQNQKISYKGRGQRIIQYNTDGSYLRVSFNENTNIEYMEFKDSVNDRFNQKEIIITDKCNNKKIAIDFDWNNCIFILLETFIDGMRNVRYITIAPNDYSEYSLLNVSEEIIENGKLGQGKIYNIDKDIDVILEEIMYSIYANFYSSIDIVNALEIISPLLKELIEQFINNSYKNNNEKKVRKLFPDIK